VVQTKKLKVGLITDGSIVYDHVAQLADWIESSPNHELRAEIVQRVWFLEDGRLVRKIIFFLKSRGIKKSVRTIVFRFVSLIDLLFTKVVSPQSLAFLESNSVIKPTTRIEVVPLISPRGQVYEFSNSDLNRIRDLGCDVLIRCGSGILRGEILTCVPFGVLSFHHGDNRQFRGGPPGFWEVFTRSNQTGFIVQRLTETLDGGEVLVRGSIGTKPLFTWNRADIFQHSLYSMCHLLEVIADKYETPCPEKLLAIGNIYSVPSVLVSMTYLTNTLKLLIKKLFEKAFRNAPKWSVRVFKGNWDCLDPESQVVVSCPKDCFIADPFLYKSNSQIYLFVEEFSFRQRKAHIAVYEVASNSVNRLGIAIREEFHISFPFVFEIDGELFMCPESLSARQVRLYRVANFPLEWELVEILMSDVDATDPVIFFRNHKWWLLFTRDLSGRGDSHSILELFSSETLIGGFWKPHPSNPVRFDAVGGRNGGFVDEHGLITRFGQIQGFNQYGKDLCAFRIKEISEECYREEEVPFATPNLSGRIFGIHHLSSIGSFTAIDTLS